MSLRLRRGGGTVTPPEQPYGPTLGAQSVRDDAGPRGSIGMPGGSKTTLVPTNSVAANQALINGDATGVIWWPKGTYAMTTTGYSIKAGLENYLETGPLRTATDTALLDMSGTADGQHAVTIAGANVEWHGGIIEGGYRCMMHSSGGIADGLLVEDAELRSAARTCFQVTGAFDGTNDIVNMTVRYCLLHHGGRYNAHVFEVQNLVWEHNESHDGNASHFGTPPPTRGPDDEGASKFLFVSPFSYRYNWDHENDGAGAWPDTGCTNAVFEENVFEENYMSGLFNEANSGVTIQRNLFRDNGITHPTAGEWYQYMSNLIVNRSPNTTVVGNEFVTTPAVTASHQADMVIRYQSVGTQTGLRVTANRFKRSMASGTERGFISHWLSLAAVAHQTSDNRYDATEYHVPSGQTGADWFHRAFSFGSQDQTFTEWRAGDSLPFAPGSFYDPAGSITGDL